MLLNSCRPGALLPRPFASSCDCRRTYSRGISPACPWICVIATAKPRRGDARIAECEYQRAAIAVLSVALGKWRRGCTQGARAPTGQWYGSTRQELRIPAFQLISNNQLQFRFSPRAATYWALRPPCRASRLARASTRTRPSTSAISPTTPPCPTWRCLLTPAIPFTRYADLSETVIVLSVHDTGRHAGAVVLFTGAHGPSHLGGCPLI